MSVPDGWGATAGWPPWATTDPEGASEPAAAPGDATLLAAPAATVPAAPTAPDRPAAGPWPWPRGPLCRARCPPQPPRPPQPHPLWPRCPPAFPWTRVHVPLRRGASGRMQVDPRSMVRHLSSGTAP